MDIRQIAVVAEELQSAQAAFFRLLDLNAGFQDPDVGQFGLHNVVMRLGDTYLEVVSPTRAGTTAGRLLERRGGDCGYMVIVQVDDFATHRLRMLDNGIRIVWESPYDHARAMHLHPRDVPGAIVSLDEMTPPEAWHWAGENWETQVPAGRVGAIRAAEIRCSDPAGVAARWALAFGTDAIQRDKELVLQFDNTEVRFVAACAGEDDALTAIDIYSADAGAVLAEAEAMSLPVSANSVSLCGVRLNFIQ